jgi:hypothetical protein
LQRINATLKPFLAHIESGIDFINCCTSRTASGVFATLNISRPGVLFRIKHVKIYEWAVMSAT